MVDAFVLTAIICGLGGVALYVFYTGRRAALEKGFQVFLCFIGAVVGVKLILYGICPSAFPLTENDRIYVCFGGLGLFWVSIQIAYQFFRDDPAG